MRKGFKQLAAAVLSAAMVLTPSFASLAADPTTTEGTGNILAYHIDSYIVPTDISVALNPQGYKVQLRNGTEEADYSTAQIVTLNYGLANLSTGDKKFKLSLEVTSANSGITFVDSAAAATGDTALAGEYKMYLALVPATSTAPTTLDGDAFEVEDVASGANTTNVTRENMADVAMTGDTAKAIAFAGDGNISATNTFELDAATYVVKDGGALNFETTQASLADEMELSEVGGISGFTLTGAMNTKADWATLETKSLTFKPTYEFIDVAAEAAQAAQGAAPSIATTAYTYTAGQAIEVEFNLGSGTLAATGVESAVSVKKDGVTPFELVENTNYSISGNKIVFSDAQLSSLMNVNSKPITITFNDAAATEIVITITKA